jgi:hypothetical protein
MKDGIISRSPRANDLLRRLSLSSRVGSLLWDVTEPIPVGGLKSSLGENGSQEDLVAALYLGLETGVWVIEGAAPPWRQ